MPARWTIPEKAPADTGAFSDSGLRGKGAPLARVMLRPNRSLSRRGLAWLLLIAWLFLLVPAVPLLGSAALWVMLPFLLFVLLALWISIEANNRDGRELCEELTLWRDLITVQRHARRKAPQNWHANPYWTTIKIHAEGGPVENYITLKGNGREIELGAFLSPDERVELFDRLQTALARARAPVHPAPDDDG